jgi:hypothetical protein
MAHRLTLVCLLAVALCSCALSGPAGGSVVSRGQDSRLLYLPRVSSNGASNLFLPVVRNSVVRRSYFPRVASYSPQCLVYGSDCVEPNNTLPTAVRLVEFGRPYFGTVYTMTPDISDYFAIWLTAGRAYTFTLSGGFTDSSPFGNSGDLDLYVYDGTPSEVGRSNITGQVAESVRFAPIASATYYVRVYGYRTPLGSVAYRLEAR